MTSRDEARHLARRSSEFMTTAKIQFEQGLYGLAAFSLGQALRLYLKHKLLLLGVKFPWTHSVRRLLELLTEVSSERCRVAMSYVMERYLMELSVLEDAYITSRYVAGEFSREEVERLYLAVEDILGRLRDVC
ncbi:MAG: HEPN domain-containing protein [Aigarchaeota archaeon]|nr:HEPN domain-containing protein [Candidatus Pelearchaeum maunauluense]